MFNDYKVGCEDWKDRFQREPMKSGRNTRIQCVFLSYVGQPKIEPAEREPTTSEDVLLLPHEGSFHLFTRDNDNKLSVYGRIHATGLL